MLQKGSLIMPISDCFIGFDAEWTKNYKIKNGNVPFCFSIVAVKKQDISIVSLERGELPFEYVQFYCQKREEADQLIETSNAFAEGIVKSLGSCILCGHQVSSDFSILANMAKAHRLQKMVGIETLQAIWHDRKGKSAPQIIDTRYDIEREFMGASRRLVDVCNDFLLDVRQPELRNTSMTSWQNQFYDKGDIDIYERIAVMNLRHSLCAIILYWLNATALVREKMQPLNLNKTIYNMLQSDFAWITSDEFAKLL